MVGLDVATLHDFECYRFRKMCLSKAELLKNGAGNPIFVATVSPKVFVTH